MGRGVRVRVLVTLEAIVGVPVTGVGLCDGAVVIVGVLGLVRVGVGTRGMVELAIGVNVLIGVKVWIGVKLWTGVKL